jgi:hypothetical protein
MARRRACRKSRRSQRINLQSEISPPIFSVATPQQLLYASAPLNASPCRRIWSNVA